MIKKSFIKSFLKLFFPFKSFRRVLRSYIQHRHTLRIPDISNDDKEMLKVFYKSDVEKLSILLKRDLNYWVK